jgi:hypothetical protein
MADMTVYKQADVQIINRIWRIVQKISYPKRAIFNLHIPHPHICTLAYFLHKMV